MSRPHPNDRKIRERPIKRYVVSLDEDPSTRWDKVIDDNRKQLDDAMKELNGLIPSGILFYIVSLILELCVYLNIVMYSKEIKAISKKTKISIGKLVLLQLYYELNAHCTSIVSRSDRGLCLTRTMDWDLMLLKDLTIEVVFRSKGRDIFIATSWVGYVGIFTGLRPGEFAVSLNYRRTNDSLLKNVFRTIMYEWPTGFLIRDVLTNCSDYKEAKAILSNSQLISPCYFTMVGRDPEQNQGCVIIRDRNKTHRLEELNDEFYLCQTNHDKHACHPENIIHSKERIVEVQYIMTDMDNIKDPDHLLNEIKSFPLINEETIYTTQMIPKESHLKTRVLYE